RPAYSAACDHDGESGPAHRSLAHQRGRAHPSAEDWIPGAVRFGFLGGGSLQFATGFHARQVIRRASEFERVAGMSQTAEAPKTLTQKLLDVVERVGNKVPHPAVLFFVLIALVIVLSIVLAGISVSYQRLNPETHKTEEVDTAIRSLLSPAGIRFIFTSVVPNFINFGPVGIIMVAMIGIGLAEQAGLIQALIRKIVIVAPRSTMTAIIVTLGVMSSIA